MKKSTYLLPVLMLLTALLFISCKGGKQDENQSKDVKTNEAAATTKAALTDEYTGLYKSDSTICKLTLKISKDEKGYSCLFTEGKKEFTGTMTLRKEDTSLYMDFNINTGGKNSEEIGGVFEAGAITIQNQGNAMNQYNYFKTCDAKYIELTKK